VGSRARWLIQITAWLSTALVVVALIGGRSARRALAQWARPAIGAVRAGAADVPAPRAACRPGRGGQRSNAIAPGSGGELICAEHRADRAPAPGPGVAAGAPALAFVAAPVELLAQAPKLSPPEAVAA
jgi:hypothetical protein